MYVICTASYSLWAVDIVRDGENPIFLLASCCKVEVVKGAEGDLLEGFFSIFFTLKVVSLQSFKNFSDSSLFSNLVFSSAWNSSLFKGRRIWKNYLQRNYKKSSIKLY